MATRRTKTSSDGSEAKKTEPGEDCPRPDEYGRCVCCGHRYKVSCTCNTTFAERARSVLIDAEALRRFHGR